MSETDGLQLPVGVTEKAFMQQIARMENKLAKMEGQQISKFKKANSGSARTFKELDSAAVKTFENISSKAASASKTFLMGFAGGAIATATAALTTGLAGTVRGIAAVGDEAKRAGLSMQVFQEWRFVAEQNRIGIDALVDGFKELSLRADEFIVTGAGSAQEAFMRLGYSAAQLKEKLKDPSALMLEIIGRMQNLDKAAQIRIADELFGGTGGEQFVQILDQGEEGIRKTIDRGHELGAVMDDQMIAKAQELDRKWNELATTTANWFKGFSVGAAGVLSEIWSIGEALAGLFPERDLKLEEMFPDEDQGRQVLGDAVYDALAKNKQAFEKAKQDVEALRLQYESLGHDAIGTASQMAALAAELDAMGLTEQAAVILQYANRLKQTAQEYATGAISAAEFSGKIYKVQSDAETAFNALQSVDGVSFNGAIAEMGRLGEVIAGVIGLAGKLKGAMPGGLAQDTGTGLTSSDTGLMPPMAQNFGTPLLSGTKDLLPPTAKTSSSGSGRSGGGKRSRDEYKEAIADLQEEIALLNAESAALLQAAGSGQYYAEALELAAVKADLLNAAQRQGIEITPEVTAQIDEMAAAYIKASQDAERLKTATERGQDAFKGLFSSILDGADGVKGALANLLMQMAEVQLQNAAMKAMTSMGGGGLMGIVGGLLTPWGGGRATGGPVSAGTSYLVGEKGPEIITMGGNGYVTPNHELGGGGAPVINFHVDARGASEGVDALIARKLNEATPQIVNKALGAVKNATQRGR